MKKKKTSPKGLDTRLILARDLKKTAFWIICSMGLVGVLGLAQQYFLKIF